jgi:hypothetical protein
MQHPPLVPGDVFFFPFPGNPPEKPVFARLQWRQLQFQVDNMRADYGKVNKEVATKKKAGEDADALIAQAKVCVTDPGFPMQILAELGARTHVMIASSYTGN